MEICVMDTERLLFEKGCFLPSWTEDTDSEKEVQISQAYDYPKKDISILFEELNEIKEHIQDVRRRLWEIDKLINFHTNGIAEV